MSRSAAARFLARFYVVIGPACPGDLRSYLRSRLLSVGPGLLHRCLEPAPRLPRTARDRACTRSSPGSTRSFWSTITSVTTASTRGLAYVMWPWTKASSVATVSITSLKAGTPHRNTAANDPRGDQADDDPAAPVPLRLRRLGECRMRIVGDSRAQGVSNDSRVHSPVDIEPCIPRFSIRQCDWGRRGRHGGGLIREVGMAVSLGPHDGGKFSLSRIHDVSLARKHSPAHGAKCRGHWSPRRGREFIGARCVPIRLDRSGSLLMHTMA